MSASIFTHQGISIWAENWDGTRYPIVKVQTLDPRSAVVYVGAPSPSAGDSKQSEIRWQDTRDCPIAGYCILNSLGAVVDNVLPRPRGQRCAPAACSIMAKKSNSHVYGTSIRVEKDSTVQSAWQLEIRQARGKIPKRFRALDGGDELVGPLSDEAMKEWGVEEEPFVVFNFVFQPARALGLIVDNSSRSTCNDTDMARDIPHNKKRDSETAGLQEDGTQQANTDYGSQVKRARVDVPDEGYNPGSATAHVGMQAAPIQVAPIEGAHNPSMGYGTAQPPQAKVGNGYLPEGSRVMQASRYLGRLSQQKHVLENDVYHLMRIREAEVNVLREALKSYGQQAARGPQEQ